MKNHPLFDGFVDSGLTAAGAALGFDVCIVSDTGPILPLTGESMGVVVRALALHGGAEGFYQVASWKAPGVYCVAYAKPLTDLALACYLAGLGVTAHRAQPLRPSRYRYSHAKSDGLKGWSLTRSDAALRAERDALDHGVTDYQTHEVKPPLASWLYSGASVLEDVRLAAFAAAGPDADSWLQLPTGQVGQFVAAQALLLDGFAWHVSSTPEFGIQASAPCRHNVWASGSE